MPPAPSTLVEEGREFWRRYPSEFQKGFSQMAVIGPQHEKYLKPRYFTVLGSVPKMFVARNRRRVDISIKQFEQQTNKDIDRSGFGLPIPNREAAYKSLAKYAKDVPGLSPRQVMALNTAAEWLALHFGPHMHNSRIKTYEEVIVGIDRSTSGGFPWTRKYPDKGAMIDTWAEMPQYMAEDWERLKLEDYVAVFGNSLKEEIRPSEKIEQNSLRTFTAGPAEMTIHGNRLFEDMNEKFYASHLRTASAVGFTPFKGGWRDLVDKLKQHPNGFALDESQYDSSLRAFLMWMVAEFRWSMLRVEDQTEENRQRIRVYYKNLINTLIITSDGVFVFKQGGNPSGSVNTISDNTLILFVLIAFAWLMLSPMELRSYESFMDHTALALVGDDNTWTVSDRGVQFYNARTVIAQWAEIGITTTTDSLDPRPPDQLDFLSAFTVYVDGVPVPLYNRNKLLTSLLYSEHPDDPTYTLIRAAAILRVGWVDPQLRGYLRELISWLIDQYGDVLRNDKEWRVALTQVATDSALRDFFIMNEGVEFPLISQGRNRSPGVKEEVQKMATVIALPQRQRKARRPRARRARVGPLLPNGAFKRKKQKKAPRRRRQRARDLTGISHPRGMPDGLKSRASRFYFDEDEFIVDLLGQTAFGSGTTTTALSFPINPGQIGTFPFLQPIAQRFEKYVFTKLQFYYKHEVSEFATAGTIGKVMLGVDYDAADAPLASKTQMMSLGSRDKVDKMPCQDMYLNIDCRTAFENGPKYVRPGILPGGSDIKMYDVGNLQFAAAGTSDSTTKVGELHVRYSGYFEKPIIEASNQAPANMAVSFLQSTAAEAAGATNVAKTLALATATTNGLSVVNTAGSMVPPVGNYLLDVSVVGSNSSASNLGKMVVDIQKNGVTIFPSTKPTFDNGGALGVSSIDIPVNVWVSANGTDAFTVVVTCTYGAGTVTLQGMARWKST